MSPNQPHVPPANLPELLAAATPELEAFEPSDNVRRQVSRERAVDLTVTLRRSWTPLLVLLDTKLSPAEAEQRKLEFQRVETRVWVFYAADLAALEDHADVPRHERIELSQRVSGHDRFLLKWATPLFEDDPRLSPTLRDISRGTGVRDDAEDVLRLVALFRGRWPAVDGKSEVTAQRLEQAQADASKQLELLSNSAGNPARTLANAAYSLWYRDYDELMQLGRYLTRREPDPITRFPGVRELATTTAVAEPAEPDEPTLDV